MSAGSQARFDRRLATTGVAMLSVVLVCKKGPSLEKTSKNSTSTLQVFNQRYEGSF